MRRPPGRRRRYGRWSGPGTTTAWSTSLANHASSPSQIGTLSIQIGVPGTNASGNTINSAPAAADSSISASTLRVVASRSISTYAACTAATVNVRATATSSATAETGS